MANYFLWGFFRDAHYTMVLVAGIGFWAGCILALHQVKISVDKTDPEKLHAAILLFFVINAFVSAINLLAIIVE
ncbi:MAG: hypothetical protein JWQ78_59, partial [Sediminibacterium sp.]|nr:hypothetical protein [Sediminibacterium sp.]